MIGIKNKGTETVTARYDGQEFDFSPDAVVACSEEAAAHIFGYGVPDKSRALHRLGWMRHGGDLKDALKRLDDFAFLAVEEVKYKEEPTPLHLPNKAGPDIPMAKAPEGQRRVAVK